MHHRFRTAAFLFMICSQALAEEDLVTNGSFENADAKSALPAGWGGDKRVYSRAEGAGREGGATLKFESSDPTRYVLCTQTVPVRPGWKYCFSGWVKTREISGEESGATLCMEWSDAQGKWLGGSYPSGVKGTHDWRRVEGIVRIPAEARTVRLSCYVRRGMTGTAWFDDVRLERLFEPAMRSMLASPIYRGRITAAGPAEVCVRVRLNRQDFEFPPGACRLVGRLQTTEGRVLGEASVEVSGESGELRVAARNLAPGNYCLVVRLIGSDGKELQADRHALVRVADDFRPRATIDEHRRLLVDGKPFFPLGMYWTSITEADLALVAKSQFNCLMPYGSPKREQMDLADRYGLKVIYSIKDWYFGSRYCPKWIASRADEEPMVRQRVRQMRDHPALLAWYLNDELSQTFLPQLEDHQRWVAEEDPDHPTWSVLYQYKEVGNYLRTFDVIGTDPYPIGRKPASMAAEWTAETFRQVERSRPMWQVPQLHNWANYAKSEADRQRARTPTCDEVRSMAWQCIAEGATGLVFYSLYDLKRNPDVPFDVQWAGLQRIVAEIDRLAPALLSAEPAPKIEVLQQPGWLRWIARRHQGTIYVVAVNDGDGEGEFALGLPELKGRVLRETLKPLEVRVFEFPIR